MNQQFISFADFKRRYPIRPNDEGALLGSGSYGRVFKVEDQIDTEWVAIKISEFKGDDSKSLKAEVDLAQRVPRQANIARYDACYRLETDTSISDFAIMKYYPDGNLADLLQGATLTPPQIYDITKGILIGLQHLHRHRIVHRDFKPANILISRDNTGRFIPKIADFGLSRLVTSDELDNSDFDLSDGRGTASYKAPEQIEGSRVSFNLDLWAFGVILYEILTGEKPFRADQRNSSEQSGRREIEKKIITVELPSRINQVTEPYAAMIRRCLVRDIHERVRKEDELLDLLDTIPQLLSNAQHLVDQNQYGRAKPLFEQILAKREHHAVAEKGLAQCQSELGSQQVDQLLTKADTLVKKEQFELAQEAYEQILQLDSTHSVASRGRALCVSRTRPEPVPEVDLSPAYDRTDVFQESTDIYSPPVELESVHIQTATAYKQSETMNPSSSAIKEQHTRKSPDITSPNPRIPWRILVPVAICLGGLVFYYNTRTVTERNSENQQVAIGDTATAVPKESGKVIPEEFKPESALGSKANLIGKRIDAAMEKAHLAYKRKDYARAIMFCKSALVLDPARQDVSAFLSMSNKAVQLQSQTTVGDAIVENIPPVVVTTEPVKEPVKQAVASLDDKEKGVRVKQEAQNSYDQLIGDGVKAIASGNNKAKAIDAFSQAKSLAKDHNLSTDKADGAYTMYISKADKIFGNEEYDGAKGWYKVAQALKDTPEVRMKIKQCTNQ